jgi:hypothetical protein
VTIRLPEHRSRDRRVPLVELVTTPPSEEPELCSWSLEPEPSTIAMRDLRLGPDYVGAVAVHGALDTLSVIDAGPLLERGAATHAFAGRAMKRVRA